MATFEPIGHTPLGSGDGGGERRRLYRRSGDRRRITAKKLPPGGERRRGERRTGDRRVRVR